MNVSERFIRRPVMTILAHGRDRACSASSRTDVCRSATCRPSTIRRSASARVCPARVRQTMAAAVATPLEKQFSTIAGIDNMTSTSSLGSTSITLQFSLDRDIDAAAQDVQAAIAKTLRQLPLGISRRRIRRRTPRRRRFCFYALTSTTLSLQQLDEVGETLIVAATLDGRRRRAGAGVRRRPSTRCASSSTRPRSRTGRSASTRSPTRSTRRTSASRPACSGGRRPRTRSRRPAS